MCARARAVLYLYPRTKAVPHALEQLVETLLYKPEGRGFDPRWCHWNFFIDNPVAPWGVNSTSDRMEYQEYFLMGKGGRCVGLTILSP